MRRSGWSWRGQVRGKPGSAAPSRAVRCWVALAGLLLGGGIAHAEEATAAPAAPPATEAAPATEAPAADGAAPPASATAGTSSTRPAPKLRSPLLVLLQEQTTPGAPGDATSPSGGGGGGGGVRISGSAELLFWDSLSGSLKNGIFSENNANSQFKATHFHAKLSASLGAKGLAYIEACFTHPNVGTQAEQAWLEYNASERVNIQAGRILIPFGLWNQIHDVYDHRTISYPLLYVGHEEQEVALNGGPQPIVSTAYSDIGVLLYGSVWLNDNDQVWYGGYVCNGRFGTNDIQWLDLWNNQQDNNSNKALGGRLVYSHGDNLSLGASYQVGRFDPANKLRYELAGFDLYYRFAKRVNLRAEYVRNPVDSFTRGYTKSGWYAMVDLPLSRQYEFVASVAGLRRHPAQRMENESRYTVGVNRRLTTSMKLKTELEYLRLGHFVGDPNNADDARFGTSFPDILRIKASLVAAF
jgi:hypothetical protein